METNNNTRITNDEYATKGLYKNSYFHIFIDGSFDKNLRFMSQESFGFFVHEYIHYLQNITTLFGLEYSTFRYSFMFKVKSQIINSQSIILPLKVYQNLKEHEKAIEIQYALGDNDDYVWIDEESLSYRFLEIQQENLVGGKICKISFKILGEEKERNLNFGAWHIKEGMAYMYQRFFDPNVNSGAIPYKLVELIAKKYYPSIYKDMKKLICICYASLFDKYPATAFFKLMDFAEKYQKYSGLNIVEYVNNEKWIGDDGEEYTNNTYIDKAISNFKEGLSKNLVSKLDAIEEILKRVSFSKEHFPLLTAMYDENFPSRSVFFDLVSYYGYTYIQASNGFFFPSTVKGQEEFDEMGIENNCSSNDVLELIAQSAIETTLISKNKSCPLQYLCLEEDLVNEHCSNSPWLHDECIYTVAAKFLNLKNKIRN